MRLQATALLLCAPFVACSEEEPLCAGQILAASAPALDFGDLTLSGDAGLIDDGQTLPQRNFVFVTNTCPQSVSFRTVCIVQRGHNQDSETPAFELEPPDRTTLGPGEDSAMRIYFDVGSANQDLDGDGVPDRNSAALVIEPDLEDSAPLLVPICGRAITDGETPELADDCAIPDAFPSADELVSQCGD